MGAYVAEHPIAQGERINTRVEELWPQFADDRQMDPVLDLREGIRSRCRSDRSRCRESFVKFHHDLHAKRRLPTFASVGGATTSVGAGSSSWAYCSASF